ncbi:MAG TPA: DUF1778 domain-containing protein [Mycobacteriales bacterium]|jgi:hypothetical protein|nr:DUF1778 domain-containing protein [Mycobacteriales bacterium]
MRSLRLDDELEDKLQRAAALRGESLSEFIRRAVDERARATLAATSGAFDDVLGVVHGGGGRARRTGDAFRAAVASSHE